MPRNDRSGMEPVVTRIYAEPRREWYIKVLQPRPRSLAGMGGVAGSVVAGLAWAALGAAAMYMMDPERGRRRQSLLRDKLVRLGHVACDGTRRRARDVAHRSQGLLAEARARVWPEHVDDERLSARVRSAMGRALSNAHAVRVSVQNGFVTLEGPVLAGEVDRLMNAVESVRGVQGVESRLDLHEAPGGEPGLQGTERARARANGVVEAPGLFGGTLAALAGGALVLAGVTKRGLPGALMAGVGTGLAARGIGSQWRGRPRAGMRRGIEVQKTITIEAPIGEVYGFFTRYDNFPLFMSRVREVKDLGNGRSRWTVAGPAGMSVSWEAVVTRMEPDRLIAWETLPGAAVENQGVIRFDEVGVEGQRGGQGEQGRRATRVDIKLTYTPPLGTLGHVAASLFGADPKSEMDADLLRLKTVIERGRTPHDAAQRR